MQPHWVDYVRANKDKYPIEGIKQALMQAGASSPEADEAVRLALAPFSSLPAAPEPIALAPPPATDPIFEKPEASDAVEKAVGIVGQAKAIVLRPREFFLAMPKEGGYLRPMLFFLAMLLLSGLLGSVSGLAVSLLFPAHAFPLTAMIGGMVVSLILSPIFAGIGAGIGFAIFKALGSLEDFETSFRCFCFTSAVAPALGFLQPLPYIGAAAGLASVGYWAYLNIIIGIEIHRIPPEKTKKVIGGIGAGLIFVNLVANYLAWRAPGKEKEAMESGMSSLARQPTSTAPAAPRSALEALPEVGGPAASEPSADVKPADFKVLKALLPAMVSGGLQKLEDPRDASQARSKVAAQYAAPDGSELDISIYDAALLEPAAKTAFSKRIDNDTASVYEKTLTFKGYPSREFYFKNKMLGKVSVLVGDRYIVEAKGSKLTIVSLREAIGLMNLPRLDSLK